MARPVLSKRRPLSNLWRLLAPLGIATALYACSSQNAGDENLDGANTPGDTQNTPLACDGDFSVGSAPARRLSREEFANTLSDLFGNSADAATELPDDNFIDGYDNSSGNASISQLTADQIFAVNQALADTLTTDPSALLPCTPAAIDDACIDSFIRTAGQQAYRHALSDEEVALLRAVYDVNADATTQERIALLLRAMLFAPQMLYRFEIGDPNLDAPAADYIALSGFEVATRLSYLAWGGPPDEALLNAAASGTLATAEGIESQLRTMLNDGRARRGMLRFLTQWIDMRGLDQVVPDAATYPDFSPELLDAMREQTVRFLEEQVIDGDGSIADLLTASSAPINPMLAQLYGVEHPTGEGWATVELPGAERKGFLTHASFLASKAHAFSPSPVQRGIYVRGRLLCQDIPEPPDNVNTTIPAATEAVTNRERFEQHVSDPSCQSCHQWIDPIGFGFESFDSIGAFRTLDNGLPVDASGALFFTDDADGTFNGAVELSEQLAASKQVAACMAEQVFRYSQGRRPEEQDACSVEGVLSHAETAGDAIKELMVAVAVSNSFRFKPTDDKQPETGEQP